MAKNINVEGTGLAERLVEYRRAHLLSREDLAERAKISERALRYIEKGQARVQERTLFQLSQALGVTYEELLVGSNGKGDAAGPARDGESVRDLAAGVPRPSRKRLAAIAGLAAVALSVAFLWPSSPKRNENRPLPNVGDLLLLARAQWQGEHEATIMCAGTAGYGDRIVYGLGSDGSDGGDVVCRDGASGRLIWTDRISRAEVERVFGDDERFLLPFGAWQAVSVDLDGTGDRAVAIVSNHRRWFPSAIRIYGGDGRRGLYFNFGHLASIMAFDLDDDGKEEVVASGTNNSPAYQNGTIIVLDETHHSGASVDPFSRLQPDVSDSCALRVVLPPFPSSVMDQVPDSRFTFLTVLAHGDPPLLTADLAGGGRKLVVTLSADLQVRAIHVSDNFRKFARAWPDSARAFLEAPLLERIAAGSRRFGVLADALETPTPSSR